MGKHLRNWWNSWAKIDAIALGIGLVLIWGFINYRGRNPNADSPILDLWPNIATDLLGVWLSVRLIDAIIQSREQRQGVRRELVGNLNYVRSEARKLLPSVYHHSVETLRDELMWAKERFPKRRRYLDQSEQKSLENTLSRLDALIGIADEYIQARQTVERIWREIDHTIDRINELRNAVENLILQVNLYGDKDQLEASVSRFSSLLSENGYAFSSTELHHLQSFHHQLDALIGEGDSETLDIDKPDIRRIYRREILWLSEIEGEYNRMDSWRDFNYKGFLDGIAEAKAKVAENDIPGALSSLFASYIEAVQNAATRHSRIMVAVAEFVKAADQTRFDILEETEID